MNMNMYDGKIWHDTQIPRSFKDEERVASVMPTVNVSGESLDEPII